MSTGVGRDTHTIREISRQSQLPDSDGERLLWAQTAEFKLIHHQTLPKFDFAASLA